MFAWRIDDPPKTNALFYDEYGVPVDMEVDIGDDEVVQWSMGHTGVGELDPVAQALLDDDAHF